MKLLLEMSGYIKMQIMNFFNKIYLKPKVTLHCKNKNFFRVLVGDILNLFTFKSDQLIIRHLNFMVLLL